jgi:hypothetical protein
LIQNRDAAARDRENWRKEVGEAMAQEWPKRHRGRRMKRMRITRRRRRRVHDTSFWLNSLVPEIFKCPS